MLTPEVLPKLQKAMADGDSAVRYWGTLGILMRGQVAVAVTRAELRSALADASPEIRIVAAQALAQFGSESERNEVLPLLATHADWSKQSVFNALAALNSIDALGRKAASLATTIQSLPTNGPSPHVRYSSYVPRLVEDLQLRIKQ